MTKIADTLERQLHLARHFAAKYGLAASQPDAVSRREKPPILMTMAMTAQEHVSKALTDAKRAQCRIARAASYSPITPNQARDHNCGQCHEMFTLDQRLQKLIEEIRTNTGRAAPKDLRRIHDETLAVLYQSISVAALRTSHTTMEGD